MNKSAKRKFGLLALVALSAAAFAAGCGEGTHTHVYSDAWTFDADSHWHSAVCSHDAKENKSAHSFTETVIPPSVSSAGYTLHVCACGYSYVSDETDPLPPAEALRYNEEGHWTPVADGEVNFTPHEYEDETVAPTCYGAGYTRHVCACGYWYASDPVAPVAHTFQEGVWEHSESGHWQPCVVCGAQSGLSAHDFDEHVTAKTCDENGYTDFVCKECGYSFRGRETEKGHTYSDLFTGDEYEHWRAAICEHGQEKTDVSEHVLIGRSNVCAICGKAVSPRLAYEESADGQYYIVTGIGCYSGTALEIPNTYREKPVREIAARAFAGEEVTSVSFAANLEKIGAEAFSGTEISEVNFPKVREIGAKAFADTKIGTLLLPGTLSKLGQGAFRGCGSLQSVEIKSNVSELPASLFEGCVSLKSVSCIMPVSSVGAQAFYGCGLLTTFDLSACTHLGFSAFSDCAAFAPTTLPVLESAEQYALSGCGAVNVTLPALRAFPEDLFNGCEKLRSVVSSAEEAGDSAFRGCTSLDSVSLDKICTIGENAFRGCTSLTALSLPETLLRVGVDAFAETGLLQEDGNAVYAANVLIGGTGNLTVKAGTAGIADEAFRGKEGLSSVSLGGSVRFIGVSAFRGCTGLSEIAFPESVKMIGANAFRESGLISVTIPATVETVGDNAFYDCEKLTAAEIGAKEIGKFAFSYTGTGRTLDSPVKQRPDHAHLTQVTLKAGVEVIGSNAFQYAPIAEVSLPAGLLSVGRYAFAQTDLAAVAFPASVGFIGEYAFYGSKLTSASFGSAQGWKAGKTGLTLGTPSENANYLTSVYADVDWTRG